MKNLLYENPDKVDELPSRANIPLGGSKWGRYKGYRYPYQKVHRFLLSRVGQNWDKVFSEYVHLKWIHDEEKTREKIGHAVESKTFMKNNEIWYYTNNSWFTCGMVYSNEHRITDYPNEMFYVHPTTKILCYKKSTRNESKKKELEERDSKLVILGDYHQLIKVKGFWYEVKGKPVTPTSDIVVIDGLHYKKVKTLPETKQTATSVRPPFPQTFFGRKVVEETPKYKKTDDGYYLIPHTEPYYYRSHSQPIGKRDAMMDLTDRRDGYPYYTGGKDYRSVKITLYRQLNSKDLKKFGLKNDPIVLIKPACSVCGGVDCYQHNKKP